MTSFDSEYTHKLAIQELQVRYSIAIDSGDYNILDDIFTPDAVGIYGRPYIGIEEIKKAMFDGCDYLTSVQHLNGNHWAAIHGVNATAGCYLHVIQHLVDTPGGDLHEMGGVYDDQLIFTDNGWRITERKITIKWSKGNTLIRDSKPR
ncbi:MAG: hypothetical protein CL438_01920 [Acidimicrobiaceae bacterium]|nr:hypothetical protein [Acidimicrobiaceae bacterium]